MALLKSAWVPASESTKDGKPKVHGHGEDKSLKNGDADKTKKARFEEWARSVPNPDATEDDEETSDEESGEEGIQDTTMNNGSEPQHYTMHSGSEPTQMTLRSASSTQKTPIIPQLRKQLQTALAKRQTLDQEAAVLCAQRYKSDQEIARLCASLGMPNEPGRSFDWRLVLGHLDQQLLMIQGQRTRLREQGEGTAPLDLEVGRLKKVLGVPFEAGFVAKWVIAREEGARKRHRVE